MCSIRVRSTPSASPMGFCIETALEMKIGDKIHFKIIPHENSGISPFRTGAQVMWKEAQPQDASRSCLYGLKLTEILDDGLTKLDLLIHPKSISEIKNYKR